MEWEEFEKIVDDSIMHLFNSEWDALRENFEAWKAQKEAEEK